MGALCCINMCVVFGLSLRFAQDDFFWRHRAVGWKGYTFPPIAMRLRWMGTRSFVVCRQNAGPSTSLRMTKFLAEWAVRERERERERDDSGWERGYIPTHRDEAAMDG